MKGLADFINESKSNDIVNIIKKIVDHIQNNDFNKAYVPGNNEVVFNGDKDFVNIIVRHSYDDKDVKLDFDLADSGKSAIVWEYEDKEWFKVLKASLKQIGVLKITDDSK